MSTISFNLYYKTWNGSWHLVKGANAAYTTHGATLNAALFAPKGPKLAANLARAISEFGSAVKAGKAYGCVSITLDFEDGSGEWLLEVAE